MKFNAKKLLTVALAAMIATLASPPSPAEADLWGEVKRFGRRVEREGQRVGRRTGLNKIDDLGAVLGTVGTAVGVAVGVAAGAACTTATLGGCAPMVVGGLVGSGVGSLLADEPSGYVGVRIGIDSGAYPPEPLPDRMPSSQDQLDISRSDLSQASVDVLHEITEIKNASVLAEGVLIFGTIWKLVSNDRATSVVAPFDAANLDKNAGAVSAVGRVAACAIKALVGYRRLDGETGRKRWKNANDRSYFAGLYQQSARVCSGSSASGVLRLELDRGVQPQRGSAYHGGGRPARVEALGWFDFDVETDHVAAGDSNGLGADDVAPDADGTVLGTDVDVDDLVLRTERWHGERPVIPDSTFGLP